MKEGNEKEQNPTLKFEKSNYFDKWKTTVRSTWLI